MCFFVFCVFFPVDFRGFFGIFFDHEKVLGLAPIFPKNQKFCPFFLSIFAFFFLMGKLLAAYKFSPAESAHLGVAFFALFFASRFLRVPPTPLQRGSYPPPGRGEPYFPANRQAPNRAVGTTVGGVRQKKAGPASQCLAGWNSFSRCMSSPQCTVFSRLPAWDASKEKASPPHSPCGWVLTGGELPHSCVCDICASDAHDVLACCQQLQTNLYNEYIFALLL